jgi:cell division protein FtsW (lipid II flippase)
MRRSFLTGSQESIASEVPPWSRRARIPTYTRGPKPPRRTELGLLMYAVVVTALLYVIASLAQRSRIPPHIGPFLGIMLGLALMAHLGNRWLAPNSNPVLLPLVFLLNGIGYVVIARWDPGSAKVQAGWTALGIGIYLLTLLFVRRSRDLERYRYILLLIGGALLVAPLLPFLGKSVNGARLWVGVGTLIVQPVEAAKILICIYFASYFAANKEMLAIPSARLGNHLVVDPRPLAPILLAWLASMAIIGVENDIAFALLLFTLFIGMLWITTGRVGYLLLGLAMFAGGAVVASRLFTQAHERVLIWLNAGKYPTGNGYQLVQSWYSLAAGGIGGTGIGRGVSGTYLHGYVISDLIFTSIGEELGMVGAAAIVIAFALIVGSGLRVAQTARSDFSRLLATGLTLLVGFQAFFVMAGILRLLPFTGITLPFVAYGGSSLLANYGLIAILMRVSDEGALTATELDSGRREPGERPLIPLAHFDAETVNDSVSLGGGVTNRGWFVPSSRLPTGRSSPSSARFEGQRAGRSVRHRKARRRHMLSGRASPSAGHTSADRKSPRRRPMRTRRPPRQRPPASRSGVERDMESPTQTPRRG